MDNGSTKSTEPASTAAVIMARGIRTNWKQPLGYLFSSTTCNATELKNVLESYISYTNKTGLDVVALITDQGSNFMELSTLLGVSLGNTKVELLGKESFYFFDPPHLIKSIRNNLLTNRFVWNNKKTSCNDIVQFYDSDSQLPNRLAPKLTKAHMDPSCFQNERVKLATQVLSGTVAAGLNTYIQLKCLPEAARATMEFISRFDKLFDIFNSSRLSAKKPFIKPFQGQEEYIDFLENTAQFLKDVRVEKKRQRH